MGIDAGDYNLDGKPDIWVANYEQEAFALIAMTVKQCLHTSRPYRRHVTRRPFCWLRSLYHDFDYDGDEDILVTNGHVINYPCSGRLQLPVLLVNEKNESNDYRKMVRKKFDDDGYMGKGHMGRGLALGDLDDDGDADFIFSNNVEPIGIVENTTEQTGINVRVKLIGRSTNRDAVGIRY